ncbi:MAG: TIGR00341 family protein [Porphyromonas sp.]|nr:TIGR00341 family protein [Porphyromonas sp.]
MQEDDTKTLLSPDTKEVAEPIEEKSYGAQFRSWLSQLFNLRDGREDDDRIVESIKADVDFKGPKLWILVFAIFIASLGLNVNSTAVIIGAMLISPLMGPIIGFGLGLGISDFMLIKRSLRNFGLTTLFSILTATIYFFLSPLTQAQSELLARTQPSIYDVLIAFVGGAAGIVAASTKSKGNVIPGVAIATALMPPLCTAGYGLATGQVQFFFGAFYLYIINSVFIAAATFLFSRLLHLPRKVFVDKEREKKVRSIVTVIAICTILPSIYLSYGMIKDTYLEDASIRFVKEEFRNPNTQVIDSRLHKGEKGKHTLEVILFGASVSDSEIEELSAKMSDYGLSGVSLVVKQGLAQGPNVSELRSTVLKDMYENSERIISKQRREIDSLNAVLSSYSYFATIEGQINKEAVQLFPSIRSALILPSVSYVSGRDTVLTVLVEASRDLSVSDRRKLESWLRTRSGAKGLRIVETR